MTRPNEHNDTNNRLVDLARRLDEHWDQGDDNEQVLAESSVNLDPQEADELRKANAALGVLQRVRRNLVALEQRDAQLSQDDARLDHAHDNLPRAADSESQPITGGSATTGGASTVHELGDTEDGLSVEERSPKKKARKSHELPGSLGRFEILDVLGEGGFSRVFLARDPQLDRLVALKVPRPEALASTSDQRRFEREARAAAVLSHPAIIPIFESGTIGPITYIAFAYCQGETLADWNKRNRRRTPPRVAAAMVAHLADAVEHAHQRGVIHRDLKPANILLEQTPKSDGDPMLPETSVAQRIRITDFGLAKYATFQDDTLTVEGAVVGTPAYMSPEQARGEKSVAAATDIYSLGTIFYELLTSQRPFAKETHLQTLRAVETERPVAPRSLNRAIPRDLEAICLKCLHKDPMHRYASSHELSADLRRWLDGRPVVARHATMMEQLLAWRRRNPALAMSMVLLFLSVVAGLVTTSWQWRKASANLVESRRQAERAEGHVESTQRAIDQMIGDVADKLMHTPELSDLRKQLITKAVALQEELLSKESGVARVSARTVRAYERLASLQRDLGQVDAALASCNRAMSIVQSLPAADQEDCRVITQNVMLRKASLLKSLRRDDEAIEILQIVQAALTGKQDVASIVLHGDALLNSATLHQRHGKFDEAESSLRKGLNVLEHLPQDNTESIKSAILKCRLADTLGVILLGMGKLDESEHYSKLAKDTIQSVVDAAGPGSKHADDLAICILNLGTVLSRREKYADAAVEFRKGRDMFLRLSELYPNKIRHSLVYIQASSVLANALVADQQWSQAYDELERLIEFHENATMPVKEHPATALPMSGAHANLATVCAELGQVDEECDALQKAISIIEPLVTAHPDPELARRLGHLHSHYADTLLKHRRVDASIAEVELAEDLLQQSYAANPNQVALHDDIKRNAGRMANIYWLSESPEKAQEAVFEMVSRLPDNPKWRVAAAEMFVGLLNSIDERESLSLTGAEALRNQLEASITRLVQQAISEGYDVDALRADESLEKFLQ